VELNGTKQQLPGLKYWVSKDNKRFPLILLSNGGLHLFSHLQ